MHQYEAFANEEADKYFKRNMNSFINVTIEDDLLTQFMIENIPTYTVNSIIELGACNGFRLNLMKPFFPNCQRFVGTDLSKLSVEDGKARYGLSMYHSAIEEELNEEPFDIVIVGSVLHWVDRANLFKAIYNIDSLVKENGFLILDDFDPFFPQKNKYHHATEENIFTFKQDYSRIFLASNCYAILQKKYRTHEANLQLSQEEKNTQILSQHDRRSFTILRKNSFNYYL